MSDSSHPTPPSGSEGDGGATRRQTETLGSQGDSQGAPPDGAQPSGNLPPATELTPEGEQGNPLPVGDSAGQGADQPAAPDGNDVAGVVAGVAGDDGVAQQFMDQGDRGLAGQPDITATPPVQPRRPTDEGPNGDEPPPDVRPWYQRPVWLALAVLCGFLVILFLFHALSNQDGEKDKSGKKAAAPAQKPTAIATAPESSGGVAPIADAVSAAAPAVASPSGPAPIAPPASQPAGAVGTAMTVPSDAVVGLAAGASEQAGRAEAKADEAKAKVGELEAKVAELQRKLDAAAKAGAADAAKLRQELDAAKAALEQARKATPSLPAPLVTISVPPPPVSTGSGASAPSAATHLLVDPAGYLQFCLAAGGTGAGCQATLGDMTVK